MKEELGVRVDEESLASVSKAGSSVCGREHRRFLSDRSRLVERFALAERLVGGFAHQLRNPLAAISALAENLDAEMPEDDPRVEYTSRLLKQVAKMERLIRACLNFGSEGGSAPRRHSAESIALVALQECEEHFGRRPQLIVGGDVRELDVVVDRREILECLGLLLERAVEACPDPGLVELRVEPNRLDDELQMVCFIVRDRGSTLEAEDLSMVFEPFYSATASGLGMGLATAQALAVRNGGMVEVTSTHDETRFGLWLYAANDAGEDEVASVESPSVLSLG